MPPFAPVPLAHLTILAVLLFFANLKEDEIGLPLIEGPLAEVARRTLVKRATSTFI
jgi:hypothetical protein